MQNDRRPPAPPARREEGREQLQRRGAEAGRRQHEGLEPAVREAGQQRRPAKQVVAAGVGGGGTMRRGEA